jgi:hypothetical protein
VAQNRVYQRPFKDRPERGVGRRSRLCHGTVGFGRISR